MNNFQNLFDEKILKTNIEFAALFVLNYECLKEFVVEQVRDFYSNSFSFIDGKIVCEESENYKKKVRKLEKQIDNASMRWFVDAGAITDDDYELYQKCRKRRNEIIHELLLNLNQGFSQEDIKLFSDMLDLYQRLDRWWINEIEVPTSADSIPSDYDYNQVIGSQAILLSAINDIVLGNGAAKYSELLELLMKMQGEI